MRKIIFLTLFLIFHSLFSDEAPESLASTEGIPSSLVQGCVCAITGEYVDSEVDLIVTGPKPLVLQRTYRSSDTTGPDLSRSWQLTGVDYILANTTQQEAHASWINVILTTAHGVRASYSERVKNSATEEKFSLGRNLGYTNYGSGWMSGKTNLRNNKLYLRKKHGELSAQLINGEGCNRKYYPAFFDDSSVLFRLKDEVSRNNLKKVFFYTRQYEVDKIIQTDVNQTALYGGLTFVRHEKSDRKEQRQMAVQSDTGELVTYGFRINEYKLKKSKQKIVDYYIDYAVRPKKPWVKYEYVDAHQKNHLLLSKKINPRNRVVGIEYYQKGHQPVGDVTIHGDGSILDRVKFIKAPLNQDSPELITSHRFIYGFDKAGGNTKVYDAHNNLTHYYYDPTQRLHRIDRYSGPHTVDSREYFFWGPWGYHEGNLFATYQTDGQGIFKKAKAFRYDKNDNVISIREYGNITGTSSQPIAWDLRNSYYPAENGAEYYEKSFIYDDSNRLIKEFEPSGKVIDCIYNGDSDFVARKTTYCGQSQQREYFEYDHRYFLIKKIIDYGEGTPQRVTIYTPRDRDGLPLNVEERCQDQLLRKVYNEYSTEGYLLKQDHYDSNHVLRYTLYWQYDNHGNLVREIDAMGQVIYYFYDENDNLERKVDQDKGYETHYTYDYLNRLTNMSEVHNHCSLNTSYFYDYLGNRIKIKDDHDNETDYQYDAFGRVTKIIYPPVCNGDQQGVRYTEEFEYDSLGHLTRHKDKRDCTTYYKHNSQGKPLTITYPDKTTESFIYNLNGTLHKQTHKDNSYIIYTYDALQRITSQQVYSPAGEFISGHSFEYDFDHLVKEIDEEGLVTTYTYDPVGRLSIKMKGDQKTTYEYDSLSRLSKEIFWITDTEAQVNTFAYDLLNRVIEETVQDLSGKILTQSQYAYNPFNQKTLVKTGNSITRTEYNSRQEPTKITDAEGNTTTKSYLYNHRNRLQQKVNLVTTVDPLGLTTKQEYDALDRLVCESQHFHDKLLSRKFFFYNPEGDLELLQYDKIVDGIHISSIQHRWVYDDAGKLTSSIEAVGTPDQQTKNYFYNTFGQKSTQENPNKESLNYAYDSTGRLSEVSSTDGTIYYTYQYDRRDQVIVCTDHINQTKTVRSYDVLGRLTQETLGNGIKLTYAYDKLDRKTLVTLPDNSQIEYQYDAIYPRKVIRHKEGNSYSHAYEEYDISGNLLKSQLPFQAGSLEFTYDKLNRERKISHAKFNQEIPEKGFDAAGNLLYYSQNGEAFEFTYDNLYQLSSEKDHQYAYDSLHNRIKKNQQDCEVSVRNQVLAEDGSSYKYDENGNLIEKIEAGKITTYSYDAWNRLITVTSNNRTTHYTYDAFNRRLSKDNEQYIYDGQDEIGTILDGKIHNLRILSLSKEADIGAAVAYEFENKILVPIHDHNGNVSTLLSTNGQKEKSYRYNAFGIEQDLAFSDINPWRFSSKRYDPETGFIYFGRRYYNPQTGRWITSDPIEYADGPNLYAYVHNNPLTHFDPYGLFGFSSAELPSFSYSMDVHQHINDFASDLSFRDIYQPVSSVLSSNTFQGSMRAIGGLSEAAIGGAFALSSMGTGVGPLAGFGLMAHGFDNYQAGMRQLFNNSSVDPLTVQGLQKAGLSRNSAYLVNDGIGTFGSLGLGTAYQKFSQPIFRMFQNSKEMPILKSIKLNQTSNSLNCTQKAELLFNSWSPGTFPNRMQSILYHWKKHGNGRSILDYTKAANEFYQENKQLGLNISLKNGQKGLSIKTRIQDKRVGGFWTEDGKIITYWD